MKIAVIGANGKAGQLIVKEAVERGMDVTAVVRNDNKSQTQHSIQQDIFKLTKEDFVGFDVVVDAFCAWTLETIPQICEAVKYLGNLLTGSSTRLLVVGGAGSLFVTPEHTITVDQGPDFPEDWKPLSASHGVGLQYLRNSKYLNWTYVSPAADFQAEGSRSGEYTLVGEELTLNSKGESTISYADYAIAMVDEIENNKHNKERISVVSK